VSGAGKQGGWEGGKEGGWPLCPNGKQYTAVQSSMSVKLHVSAGHRGAPGSWLCLAWSRHEMPRWLIIHAPAGWSVRL
jgi:hypothetical protein